MTGVVPLSDLPHLDPEAAIGQIRIPVADMGASEGSRAFHILFTDIPAGPAGSDGEDGEDGAPGLAGADGSTWYYGATDPSGGSGADGDFYLQTGAGSTGVLGDIWTKAAGNWSIVANIRGAAGAGSGDVEGPAGGVTNGHVVLFDGTTGKLIKTGGFAPATAAQGALADSALQPGSIGSTVQGYSSVLAATTASFLTADETKLDGIEAAADVTDAGNVGAAIHGASAKTTPVDADTFAGIDSAASNVLKKFTWANIKATLKTYFDALYAAAAHSHAWSDITSGKPTTLSGYGITDAAPAARTVSAGTGLTGGGDLSANRTLSLSAGTIASLALADSAVQTAEASAADWRGNTADRILTTDIVYGAAAFVGLSDGASIAWDMDGGFNFSVSLGGNRTLANPTNVEVGKAGCIKFTASGAIRTIDFGTNFYSDSGLTLPISIASGADCYVFYFAQTSTVILLTGVLNGPA